MHTDGCYTKNTIGLVYFFLRVSVIVLCAICHRRHKGTSLVSKHNDGNNNDTSFLTVK